jgi:hypothetical protein
MTNRIFLVALLGFLICYVGHDLIYGRGLGIASLLSVPGLKKSHEVILIFRFR